MELNLCKVHKQEWKHSEYAPHNCDYCKLVKENEELKKQLELAKNQEYHPLTNPWRKKYSEALSKLVEAKEDIKKLSTLWNCGISEKQVMNEIKKKWEIEG